MSLIEITHVSLQYRQLTVLSDISMQLSAGESLVIMGPSGAGKSTILRLMAGLLQPTFGEVRLAGQPIQQVPPAARNIALLSQDYALYPQLTIEQNMQVALQHLSLSRSEVRQRCQEMADLFQITKLLQRLPSQISGGQAQRAAFAKALARQPQLLLLDEPLSQLDNSLRMQLVNQFQQVCQRHSIAMCWVTHDPWESCQIGSRVAVLHSGSLLQDSSWRQIYQFPVSAMVADLSSFWPINWLPLDRPEFSRILSQKPAGATKVGVRPENVVFGGSLPDDWPSWELKCLSLQDFGFAQLLTGSIGSVPFRTVITKSSDQSLEFLMQPGAQLSIATDPNKVLWLDR